MNSAREEILRRIRVANENAGVTTKRSPIPETAASQARSATRESAEQAAPMHDGRTDERTIGVADTDVIDLFVERTEDYKAVVERATSDELPARVAAAVSGVHGVLLPAGLPDAVVAAVDPSLVRSDPGTPDRLDAIEAVVTTCAVGIAETGTIVLDHTGGQGRRALTLVPDLHVCIVRGDQIRADVPTAVATLRPAVEAGHPLTWISGPSATSDIELDRVEGVHGPRRLHVIVVTD